jgi:hypothetical protein
VPASSMTRMLSSLLGRLVMRVARTRLAERGPEMTFASWAAHMESPLGWWGLRSNGGAA